MSPYQHRVRQALALHQAGKLGEAETAYNKLLEVFPDDALVVYLLAQVNVMVGRFGIASALLQRVVALQPDMASAWHDLGIALKMGEHVEEARACYRRAIDLEPSASAMAMMAGTYVNAGNPAPGVQWARKALALEPDNPHARNHLALCLLEQRQAEGWSHYARRWEVPERAQYRRDYGAVPRWDGSPVRTLALHGEQGLGDEILFLSCLPEMKDTRVVIECEPRLVPLIRRSFGCEAFGTHDELIRSCAPDAYLPVGDLPGMFAPRGAAYLTPDPARVAYWRGRLEEAGSGPYIACAWGGGHAKTHRSQRITDVREWAPIFDLPATFVCADYRDQARDEAFALGMPYFRGAIADMDEQAALVAACDATVTVCQTLAHLSGALGVPTFILTPKACAWRYLYNCTDDRMQWYADARLYRQSDAGNWSPVIQKVRHDLDAHIRGVQNAERRAA